MGLDHIDPDRRKAMLASVQGGATDASKLLHSLTVRTYWQVASRSLGRGPVCETLEKAEAELRETQLGDPSKRIHIYSSTRKLPARAALRRNTIFRALFFLAGPSWRHAVYANAY